MASAIGFALGLRLSPRNELCTQGIPAKVLATDYHNLAALLTRLWPVRNLRPILIGNDCNPNPEYIEEWLPLVSSVLDVFTYHSYDGFGGDAQLATEIMTPQFLQQTITKNQRIFDLHTQYAPASQIWVGEGAAAWRGGRTGVTNAWADSFWWADALAALAARNHTGFCRQTLVGGDYGSSLGLAQNTGLVLDNTTI